MKRKEKIALLRNYRNYLIYYSNIINSINEIENENKSDLTDKPKIKVLVLTKKFGDRQIPVA